MLTLDYILKVQKLRMQYEGLEISIPRDRYGKVYSSERNLNDLRLILKRSWNKETSSDPENWEEINPSWGQCAVTSLVVQDCFGGDIIWCNAVLSDKRNISHYFNKIDNEEVDLTRIQFPEGTFIPKGIPKLKGFQTTRDYILSFEQTRNRYEILKKKIEENL